MKKNYVPFIGVVFKDEWGAQEINKMYANNYFMDVYNLMFQIKGSVIEVMLKDSGGKDIFLYGGLKFDPVSFYRFMYLTKGFNRFNFGHIIRLNGNFSVVKASATQRKMNFKIGNVVFNEVAV